MLSVVSIAPGLSFEDIREGRIPLEGIYQKLVETWLLTTADHLLASYPPDSSYRGMAAFSLLLQFFEPHGEMLFGRKAGPRESRVFFAKGYKAFADSLNVEATPPATDVYRWGRCGLFHQARLSPRLLIDGFGMDNAPFYKNPVFTDGWLINPKALCSTMRRYLISFVDDIQANPSSDVASCFRKRMGEAISEPLQYFENHLDRWANRGDASQVSRAK